MSEAEWLTWDNPRALLPLIRGRASRRKLRLLACACCRRKLSDIGISAAKQKIEMTEKYADGEVQGKVFLAAFPVDGGYSASFAAPSSLQYATYLLGWQDAEQLVREWDAQRREFVEKVWEPGEYAEHFTLRVLVYLSENAGLDYIGRGRSRYSEPEEFQAGIDRELAAQAVLIRDVFGNPFRPVSFSPSWHTDTALSLAKQMYDSRDFSAMPILADAFQDAGCEDEQILNHCRDTSQIHVCGCWVVDLVLGKE